MTVLRAKQPLRRRAIVRLPVDLIAASREAVALGLAETPSGFIEDAVRERLREVRHARMRRQALDAMNDPDFVADLRETMDSFQRVDASMLSSAE